MLRITIDLVPFGDETRARRIGVGQIGNISYPIGDLSNYSFKFEENPWQGRVFGPYAGEIRQWPRKDHGAWEIVHAALNAGIASLPDDASRQTLEPSAEPEDAAAMLRAVTRLLPHWTLGDQEAATLLGVTARTYGRRKIGKPARIDRDRKARLSCILGIHAALHTIFAEPIGLTHGSGHQTSGLAVGAHLTSC